MDGRDQAREVAAWSGHELTEVQLDLLARYAEWLLTEGLVSGGIGPGEAHRIWDRHVCDSLAFAAGWDRAPETGLDVGSGVGLPGIPLAVMFPETKWLLLDRSRKRIDLAGRAGRVLDLQNVEVVTADLADPLGERFGAVTARGVRRPGDMVNPIRGVLAANGRGVVGLSRAGTQPEGYGSGTRVVTIPSRVLDGGATILIIDACDEGT